MHDQSTIPYGYCQCGCGAPTPIARQTRTHLGHERGKPVLYMPGHNGRRRPMEERFWAKVDKRAEEDCWEWQARRNRAGYGEFKDSRSTLAHRVAWSLSNGRPVPDGLGVLHHCDNPPCCNPAHLYAGTREDNTEDAKRRGRFNPLKGSASPKAKITEADAVEIRRLYSTGEFTQRELAKRFGYASHTTVRRIVQRKMWAHV